MRFIKISCFRVLAGIAVLLAAAAPAMAAGDGGEDQANGCYIPHILTLTRPEPGGPPTEVSVGVFVFDLFEVDEHSESFEIDFAVIQTWRDPRLAAGVRGDSLLGCRVTIDDIWNPVIEPVNQRSLRRNDDQGVQVDDNGLVSYVVTYQGEMSSPLNLRKFPFDSQRLPVHLASFVHDAGELTLIADDQWTGILDSAGLAGWKIRAAGLIDNAPSVRSVVGEHARLDHVIHVKRIAAFYVWKFTIPLCFIVLMGASVFWLDPETFSQQLQVSTGSVFALVAYLVSLSNNLPQIEYLTHMDKMVFGSTSLVFMAFGEAVITSRLVNRSKSTLARRIDWHARWVFVLLFSTLLAVTMIFV